MSKVETEGRRLSIVEALREALREEMRRDERVILLGEDIGIKGGFGGAFTVTLGLSDEFGSHRVIDTPISEAGFTGIAIGAALGGLRPVADVQYGDFLFLAMDQLANHAAKLRYMSGGKLRVPLVMRAPVGATTRGAQHAQSLESYFMHVPGLKVACPSNPYDAKGLLKTAIRMDDPVIFFEHKLLYGSKGSRKEVGGVEVFGTVPEDEYLLPFGQAKTVRSGSAVTIVANLLMVHRSIAAAKTLAQEGIEAEVIDVRTLVPFDWQTVFDSVSRTGKLVIVHEATLTGGWGAEVAARVADSCIGYLQAPIRRVTAPDTPVPFAPVMEQFYVPSVERVVSTVKEICR
ncbi:MAG TPA: alpha-ketoacid dehydrogenase subunit beta [Terriglobia bacterium]|nr:alpha-ketoacid dehydrogenase subunit beta [Terriglobia bacterium]